MIIFHIWLLLNPDNFSITRAAAEMYDLQHLCLKPLLFYWVINFSAWRALTNSCYHCWHTLSWHLKSWPLTIYLVAVRMDHFIAGFISNNDFCWHISVNRTQQYLPNSKWAKCIPPPHLAPTRQTQNSSLHKNISFHSMPGNQYYQYSCSTIKQALIWGQANSIYLPFCHMLSLTHLDRV